MSFPVVPTARSPLDLISTSWCRSWHWRAPQISSQNSVDSLPLRSFIAFQSRLSTDDWGPSCSKNYLFLFKLWCFDILIPTAQHPYNFYMFGSCFKACTQIFASNWVTKSVTRSFTTLVQDLRESSVFGIWDDQVYSRRTCLGYYNLTNLQKSFGRLISLG